MEATGDESHRHATDLIVFVGMIVLDSITVSAVMRSDLENPSLL